MPSTHTPEPCLLVIFGASGDLTERKLVPALYELHRADDLPERFAVLGVSRSDLGDEGFRDRMKRGCATRAGFDEASWASFEGRLFYEAGDATKAEGFESIRRRIIKLSDEVETGPNLLFYLSLMPQLYDSVITHIGASELVTEGRRWCSLDQDRAAWQRIVVEKPFGHDLASAAHLNRVLGRVFEEEAIFRIDHYLGKETVQNLMVFRFANAIFEPLWNRQYIHNIQITAAEKVGVEDRGSFYEKAGALRDMIQSHLLQMMAAVAMEPPNSFDAIDLRGESRKVLEAVRIPEPGEVSSAAVRGQYTAGEIGGDPYVNYTDEPGVADDSNTESFAAMRLHIDNWRWQGVPFYLRTGKAMRRKLTQIVLYFKPTPHSLFARSSPSVRDGRAGDSSDAPPDDWAPNRLVINVQPDEGISLRFEGKVPGQGVHVRSGVMDFDYIDQFGGHVPEAYGHLLLDAMLGDRSLFKDRHEIEAAWRIVMPVLDHWAAHPRQDMHPYPAGSWGPAAAEDLFQNGGHWHNPEGAITRWRRT